jgi:hypothetical protein
MTKSFNKHHKNLYKPHNNLYKPHNNIKYPKIIQEKQDQLNLKNQNETHVYEKNLPPLNSAR